MSNSTWDWPGARWWKFDFHTHTPASDDYGKGPDQANLKARTPAEWLLDFMRAGIDCVAVTDHNSGAWIDQLQATLRQLDADRPEGFRPLWLFPGVEISANGGVHVLAIFGPEKRTSDIDTLLGAVGFRGTKGTSDSVTDKSLVEVVLEIAAAGALAIPAHVDEPKGLLRLASPDTLSPAVDSHTLRQVFECERVLAIEVVNPTAPRPQVYSNLKSNWTEVLGSDAHHPTGPRCPGSHFTWVKMVSPCVDGLRLALHDGARFSVRRSDDAGNFDPLHVPEHAIKSIQISDARYMGRGTAATLAFNPWFNTLVGGRGSGKSTVVHALRLAYRRDAELDRLAAEEECRRVFEAFRRVPRNRADRGGLQQSTEIVAELVRDGVRHRLRWRQDAGGAAVEEMQLGSWAPSPSQNVASDRFPVRIFSQGQIAALAGDRQEALLGVIDEGAGVLAAKDQLRDAQSRYLALRAQLRVLDGKLQARADVVVKLSDVERKLAGFEGKEHATILRDFQIRARQQRELQRQTEAASAFATDILELASRLVPDELPDGLFAAEDPLGPGVFELVKRLHESIANASGAVTAASKALAANLLAVQADTDNGPWAAAVVESRAQYAALVQRLKDQGVADPSEYGNLIQERQRLKDEIARLDSLQKERDKVSAESVTQRTDAREARRRLSEVREAFLAASLSGNPYVRIAIVRYGNEPRAIERALREIIGAIDDRFEDDILAVGDGNRSTGMVAELLGGLDEGAQRPSNIEGRLDVLAAKFASAYAGQRTFGARFDSYLQRECATRPELLDRIFLFAPEDSLQVEYSQSGDGNGFRPISQASAGQRAAAMLAFLLAHGTEPLVLDQPEDDLDNHLIYDLIVRQIRENKTRRQLLMVTHNPNIVVNGDAEMVHAMDFASGQCRVIQSGSLQEAGIRDEVCRVMEGGREAFERRYRRLGRES